MSEFLEFYGVAALAGGIRAGVPLFYASVGEVFAERSGVINLGVEGMMLLGAMTAVAVDLQTGSAILAVLAAAVIGGAMAAVFALLTIVLRVNQIACGIGVIFIGAGISAFAGGPLVGQMIEGVEPWAIPALGSIPILGQILFQHDWLVYFAYLLVPISWILMYRTVWGLRVRAVGDDPVASEQLGISVRTVRFQAVVFGGVMAGIAGAYLSLSYTQLWLEDMVAGRGLIAIALVIFASWDPFRSAVGAFLFGSIGGIQLRIQAAGVGVSSYALSMLPYILTIVALVVYASARARGRGRNQPYALGKPFTPSK